MPESFSQAPTASRKPPTDLLSCPCCGLIQAKPAGSPARLRCGRCHTQVYPRPTYLARRVQALALAALIFYPAAMSLPMLRVERFGHIRQDSLIGGIETLFAQDYWLIGGVVLLFSVVLPPLKLMALLWLTRPTFLAHPHRALMYRWVEHLGRWGMLDVLLVAIMIAFVKLGGLVNISAGPGLTAFTLLVVLSLLASLSFDPRAMWQNA